MRNRHPYINAELYTMKMEILYYVEEKLIKRVKFLFKDEFFFITNFIENLYIEEIIKWTDIIFFFKISRKLYIKDRFLYIKEIGGSAHDIFL